MSSGGYSDVVNETDNLFITSRELLHVVGGVTGHVHYFSGDGRWTLMGDNGYLFFQVSGMSAYPFLCKDIGIAVVCILVISPDVPLRLPQRKSCLCVGNFCSICTLLINTLLESVRTKNLPHESYHGFLAPLGGKEVQNKVLYCRNALGWRMITGFHLKQDLQPKPE